MVKSFKTTKEIDMYIELTQTVKTQLIEVENNLHKLDNGYSVMAHIDNLNIELKFLLFTKYKMERGEL